MAGLVSVYQIIILNMFALLNQFNQTSLLYIAISDSSMPSITLGQRQWDEMQWHPNGTVNSYNIKQCHKLF
jgi:hypothetical protein